MLDTSFTVLGCISVNYGQKTKQKPRHKSLHFPKNLTISLIFVKPTYGIMCFVCMCAEWTTYLSWCPSGIGVHPCCHGNWHCQSTRSLPSSPSMPSSPWEKQGRSLQTHTRTQTKRLCLTHNSSLTHYQNTFVKRTRQQEYLGYFKVIP